MPIISKVEAERYITLYASKQGISHHQKKLIYLKRDIDVNYHQTFFRVNPKIFNNNNYSLLSIYMLNVLSSKQFYIDYVSQNIF